MTDVKIRVAVDSGGAESGVRRVNKALGQTDTQARKADQQTNKFNRSLAKVNSTAQRVRKSVLNWHTAMGAAAGATGLGYLIKRTIDSTAAIERNADMAGVGVEAYQELSYAASQYQIRQEALTDGLKELSLRTDEYVQTGAGSAEEAFERLGFNQEDLNKRLQNTPALMQEIIRRMEGLDKAAQIRIADELFGGQGGEQFIAMIRGGSDAFRGLRDEAHELGIVIDRDLVEQSVDARNKIDALTKILSAQFSSAMAEIAPDIADIAEDMANWVSENDEFLTQDIPKHIGSIKDSVEGLVDIYQSVPEDIRGGMGVIGALLFGKKAAYLVAAIQIVPKLANTMRGFAAAFQGELDWMKFATMNAEELAAALEEIEEKNEKKRADMRIDIHADESNVIREKTNVYKEQKEAINDVADAYADKRAELLMTQRQHDKYKALLEAGVNWQSTEAKQIRASIDAYHDLQLIIEGTKSATEAMTKAERNRAKIQQEYGAGPAELALVDKTKQATDGIGNKWEDMFDRMGNAFDGWANNYSQTLNDMLWESKLTFDGILESFGKMMTEILIQSAMLDAMGGILGTSNDEVGGAAFGGGKGEKGWLQIGASAAMSGIGNYLGFDNGGVLPEDVYGFGQSGTRYQIHEGETIQPTHKESKQERPQVNVRNINVLDPTIVGDYLGTSEGEEKIVNIMQRNKGAL